MRKSFIKKMAFGLGVVLTLSTFAGCTPEVDVSEDVAVGAEVILNGDKIYPLQCEDVLQFWFDGGLAWQKKYENFAETPLGKKIAEATGVKVEYFHPTSGQAKEQFQILMASDELPDMVNYNWLTYPGGPDTAINDQYIYKLNGILEKYCPALTKILKENPQWDKEVKTDSGFYYAFPKMAEDSLLLVSYGPILRGDWLNQLGLELPRNMNEWEKVLTAFKEEKGAAIPYGGSMSDLLDTFMGAYGIYRNWYQDEGVVKFGQAQPEYKEFLKDMNKWYTTGLIDPDFMTGNKNLTANILNGVVGSTSAWAGSGLGAYLDANSDVPGYTLVGTQFPAMDGRGNAEYSYLSRDITVSNVSITKNCKNVELAARFLDFGFTEEGDILYNFGIEGESFNWVEKNGEKYPAYSDLIYNNPEGYTVGDVLTMYTRAAHTNMPMIQDVKYIEQYYPHQEQKDAQVEWAKTNVKVHQLPELTLDVEQGDKDGDIMANVNTYVDEMTIKFITGRESLDKFDEYLQTLKEFGIEDSVKLRQDALERFNKR